MHLCEIEFVKGGGIFFIQRAYLGVNSSLVWGTIIIFCESLIEFSCRKIDWVSRLFVLNNM